MIQWLTDVAVKRPLPVKDSPQTPRILIFHTMVGNLQGTETYFRNGGSGGTYSTFGVGGPHDGPALDGVCWQWQELGMKAYAQWDGNNYADSVETADGEHPSEPWSPKQLAKLIALTVSWCKATGNPCVRVKSTSDRGIGYHDQFAAWNQNHHICPGYVRENQLKTVVIPAAAALLNPETDMDATQSKELSEIHDAIIVGDRSAWIFDHAIDPIVELLQAQGKQLAALQTQLNTIQQKVGA